MYVILPPKGLFQGILVVPGVVDSDYIGEIKVLISPPIQTVQINNGQRVTQLLLLPYYQIGLLKLGAPEDLDPAI